MTGPAFSSRFVHRSPREESTAQGPPFGGRRAAGDRRNRLASIAGREVDASSTSVTDRHEAISTAPHVRPAHVARVTSGSRRSRSPQLDWLGGWRELFMRPSVRIEITRSQGP
jgi:hypothetical protein